MEADLQTTSEDIQTISTAANDFLRNNKASRLPLLSFTPWSTRKIRKQKEAENAPVVDRLHRELIREVVDTEIDGVPAAVITPNSLDPALADAAALYVHGGAFLMGSAVDPLALLMADALGITVVSMAYSLSPEAVFPVALEETLQVYSEFIADHPPGRTVIFGVSAGGNLVLSTLLEAWKNNLPMPAAAGLFTPWTDLTGSGDSYRGNDGRDCVIAWKNQLDKAARCYIGTEDPTDPRISPIYAKYPEVFPPTIITTGTRDLFLSDCTRLYWILRSAGTRAALRVWEGMWHAFNVEPDITEGRHAREEVAEFLVRALC